MVGFQNMIIIRSCSREHVIATISCHVCLSCSCITALHMQQVAIAKQNSNCMNVNNSGSHWHMQRGLRLAA